MQKKKPKVEEKKQKKKKVKKEKRSTEPDTFVDPGDIVEDFEMSDLEDE